MSLECIISGIKKVAIGASLLALAGCGGGSGGGSSSNPLPAPEIKVDITDSQGEADFVENSNNENVIIEVRDIEDNTLLENKEVTFLDENGFEFFCATDPLGVYLPTKGIFPHNSRHTLFEGKKANGTYLISEIIDEDVGLAIWEWQDEYRLITEETYVDTVDYDEYLDMKGRTAGILDCYWDKVLYFVGPYSILSLIKPSEVINVITSTPIDPPQRWDYYTYSGPEIGGGINITLIPSNVPEVILDNFQVIGSDVSVSWHGEDKTEYDLTEGYTLPTKQDITVLLGPTLDLDLEYSCKIFMKPGDILVFEEPFSPTLTSLSGPCSDGGYSLEVLVRDEVGNIGSVTKAFSVPNIDKILFVSNRDGDNEVYKMNSDGSNQINLTNNIAGDGSPAWSPDGITIAFRSGRDGNWEIYKMNADGTNQVNLTNNGNLDNDPAWSPDGCEIFFGTDRDGNWEIYKMNADGTNQVNLTNNLADDYSPTSSPDGTKIAFISERDGDNEIYKMNLDGTNQVNLTNNLASDNGPAWSPDGIKILFNTDRNGNGEIYRMDVDGINQINLTNNIADDYVPAWSPDGNYILFHTNRDVNWEIYKMDADGINQINLTNTVFFFDGFPAWSP